MIDLPGVEHSGIWAHGSNIREIHPEELDLLLRLKPFTNLPLKFLYENWKRESRALPGAPFKDTHSLVLACLASKKYKKTSIDDEMLNWAHKILLGCSCARMTLSLVKSFFLKMDKGRCKRTFLKKVA